VIIAILGAHGQIARTLTPLLVAQGHVVRGIVRSEDQFQDIRDDGALPVLLDLEDSDADQFDEALRSADAVVFAAGAGPGSGPDRKRSLDRDGAIAAVESAARVSAAHFAIVSSMGADDPPQDDEDFSVYLRAKAAADDAVRATGLVHTIIRPGALTDDDATGRVSIDRSVARGEIPRGDVAAVLAEFLERRPSTSATVELVAGDQTIPEAVARHV
jgi:uncharacterized protein YbjT (DUF2867 family)